MVSKIDKVLKNVNDILQRINKLELAKIEEEDMYNKIGDVAEIVALNSQDLAEVKKNMLFFADLVSNLAKKSEVETPKSDDSSLYL